jgi:hypothetical protein
MDQHGQEWCNQSSDRSIASLIGELQAYVSLRHEDVAWFIVEYRKGIPLEIPAFCLRLSSAALQDDLRKSVVATMKEARVADHVATAGEWTYFPADVSVRAFCHWALSQVAGASEVAAFFDRRVASDALGQLGRGRASDRRTPNRQAGVILGAWIEYRTGSKFKGNGSRLPTLEELSVEACK